KGKVKSVKENKLLINIGEHTISAIKEDNFSAGDDVLVSVRPEKLNISKTPDNTECSLPVTIDEFIYVGSLTKIVTSSEDGQKLTVLQVNDTKRQQIESGNYFINWHIE